MTKILNIPESYYLAFFTPLHNLTINYEESDAYLRNVPILEQLMVFADYHNIPYNELEIIHD